MIKILRTSKAFVILSVALTLWLAIWSRVPSELNGDRLTSKLSQRPVYVLVRNLSGNHPYIFISSQPSFICVAETLDGPRVVDFRERPFPDLDRQIISFGCLSGWPNSSEAYGLLAPVVSRHHAHYTLDTDHPKIPLISYDKALQIAHEAGRIKYLPLNGWRISWLAAAHDLLFIITLIAWLVSLTGVPRWVIWKRITPAQHRRANRQCQHCAYNLINTGSPCPECGTQSSSPSYPEHMRRLLIHPNLMILLPFVLVLWFAAITVAKRFDNHGILVDIVSNRLQNRLRSSTFSVPLRPTLFLVTQDGSLDVSGRTYFAIGLVTDVVVAYVIYNFEGSKNYGLVYAPLRSHKYNSTVTWLTTSNEYAIADLEAALAPYLEICNNPSATDSERAKLERTGLTGSTVLHFGLPLVRPSKSYWSVDPGHLAGELSYYTLFIWWIITLIYARKIWPKHDSSRCPTCDYETAGLTTQICPECGNSLPPSPSRGEGVCEADE